MQIHLQTDLHVSDHERMARHVEGVLEQALGRVADSLTRVEAHVGGGEGHAKSGDERFGCTLEARLVGLEPVAVSESAATEHQAIHGAVDKLKRAVESALARQAAHRRSVAGSASDVAAEGSAD